MALKVFLTGASTGIGESFARHYAGQGAQLGLVARSADKLKALADVTRTLRQRKYHEAFLASRGLAALAAWLASDDSSFCTGAVFDASGGRATY